MAALPTFFKRGSSFSMSLKIPDSIENGMFQGWQVKCQVRKKNNDFDNGFIADVACIWVDPITTRVLALQHDATDNWPVGEAEFDILFVSPKGQRVRSNTWTIEIIRGVTQNG